MEEVLMSAAGDIAVCSFVVALHEDMALQMVVLDASGHVEGTAVVQKEARLGGDV